MKEAHFCRMQGVFLQSQLKIPCQSLQFLEIPLIPLNYLTFLAVPCHSLQILFILFHSLQFRSISLNTLECVLIMFTGGASARSATLRHSVRFATCDLPASQLYSQGRQFHFVRSEGEPRPEIVPEHKRKVAGASSMQHCLTRQFEGIARNGKE